MEISSLFFQLYSLQSISKITFVLFFFASITALIAASLEGLSASAVPEIKIAFVCLMYSSSMSSTLNCKSAIQFRYIRILLSFGESISVKVSPNFSPFVHFEMREVSIPCSLKQSTTNSPNWSSDTFAKNPAFSPCLVTPTAMFAGEPPTNFSNI